MFDISFTEIMVIAVVALIVVGPERLPKVARTLGHLLGRVRRYVSNVKNDIQQEMELEELNELHSSMQKAAHSIESSVREEVSELKGIEKDSKAAPVSAPQTKTLREGSSSAEQSSTSHSNHTAK